MSAIRNVLITGASGTLAPYVIDRLRGRFRLTLTARRPLKQYGDVPFALADLTDTAAVARAAAGQDAVVHLAAVLNDRLALPAAAFADGMVKATWNIAEACAAQGVRRIVHVSSILACGQPKDTSQPYKTGDPASFVGRDLLYPLAKHLGETLLDAYRDAHGLAVIHLRPGVIAGDPRYPPPTRKPDSPRYWFRHVDPRDVAQAVEAALDTGRTGGCYHLLAGRADAMFDWQTAAGDIGYRPAHNWPDIPDSVEGAHDAR